MLSGRLLATLSFLHAHSIVERAVVAALRRAKPLRSQHPHYKRDSQDYAKLRDSSPQHYPLNHLGRRFVVDLQAQFFELDGQIPTAYPPQFFDLEFTE